MLKEQSQINMRQLNWDKVHENGDDPICRKQVESHISPIKMVKQVCQMFSAQLFEPLFVPWQTRKTLGKYHLKFIGVHECTE